MSELDATVPGDPEQARQVARWLRHVARSAETSAEGPTRMAARGGDGPGTGWAGWAVVAFHEKQFDILRAVREALSPLNDRAESVDAYAGQLLRARAAVDRAIEDCRHVGLTVVDTKVTAPVQMAFPAERTPEQEEQHALATRRTEAWNHLVTTYAERIAGLRDWVATNLPEPVPQSPFEQVSGWVRSKADPGEDLRRVSERWEGQVEDRRAEVERADEDLRDLRATNARRASNLDEVEREFLQEREAARARLHELETSRAGAVMRHLPAVADVATFSYRIASGEDWVEVTVDTAGGALGGGVGGLVGGGLGAAAGSEVGSRAASGAYGLVPQEVREAISAGPGDALDRLF